MAFSFFSNWPAHQQAHHVAADSPPPPLPELSTFHDNFTLSDICINPMFESNHRFSSSNNGVTTSNLSFQDGINYPTLSSSYNPLPTQHLLKTPLPVPDLSQYSSSTHECDHAQFFQMNPILPEIYPGCGSSAAVMDVDCRENGGGEGRLSAQSMAARVRRRKISQKTLELGKLVPGGHRMNTAEMFQAAFKYIKFLQAQVAVLRLMSSSLEPDGEELQALVTSTSVQEKLYSAEKCIVTQTLWKTLTNNHQE